MHPIHALLTNTPTSRVEITPGCSKGSGSCRAKRIGKRVRAAQRDLCPTLNCPQVPAALEAVIASSQNPVEIAWLKHDLLFFRWTLHHPWRSRNLAECGLKAPAQVNLIIGEIPLDLEPFTRTARLGQTAAETKPWDPVSAVCLSGSRDQGKATGPRPGCARSARAL
jgi:hypothetical protein